MRIQIILLYTRTLWKPFVKIADCPLTAALSGSSWNKSKKYKKKKKTYKKKKFVKKNSWQSIQKNRPATTRNFHPPNTTTILAGGASGLL